MGNKSRPAGALHTHKKARTPILCLRLFGLMLKEGLMSLFAWACCWALGGMLVHCSGLAVTLDSSAFCYRCMMACKTELVPRMAR
eukprot:1159104-Pelagomonas_calceolata.AAC.3